MIEILKNEKFLIGYNLNNDEEFSLSDDIPDDFIVVTTKRIIKRTQSSFKWDYKILLISEIRDIKISKGVNLFARIALKSLPFPRLSNIVPIC